MSVRLPVRRSSGHVRRTRTARRASAGLTSVRSGAILIMLACVGIAFGALNSTAFAYQRTAIDGPSSYVSTADAVQAMGLASAAPNLFTVSTARLEADLLRLPAVTAASVSVELPGTLRVALTERVAILAWVAAGHRFAVDRNGLLFAELPTSGADGLPSVLDRRANASTLAVGSRLDPLDLDVATRLGSLRPADLGSAATSLAVSVDDADGYLVTGQKVGWTAVFGIYTANLRPPDLIVGQVRLLRSLLAGREATIARVVLADDRNGTYTTR